MKRPPGRLDAARGFTLIEVMVALLVVAMGLAALMITVSSTARTSGYLREKTLAQWIALNRLTEVRLKLNPAGSNTDAGEINFGNRTWHYDTRYFDTSIATMKRVVVRVYAGDSKTKGNPVIESTGFLGSALAAPGGSNAVDWTLGSTATAPGAGTPTTGNPGGNGPLGSSPGNPVPSPIVTPLPTTTQ